jgi:hypothetical protein
MLPRKLLNASLIMLALSITSAYAHPKHPRPQTLPPVIVPARTSNPYTITVDANPVHALNHFAPNTTFGVGVDGVPSRTVSRNLHAD